MVYLHVPFCRSWCTYCAFYSEICSSEDFSGYLDAVLKEIESRKEEFAKEKNTFYIGGGTPSVLPPDCLSAIASKVREVLGMRAGEAFEEFTVEVNPDDIVRRGGVYVAALAAMGVNRVSMGVQSFDDGILRWMNRRHDAESALRAFSLLREGGIENISIDLIFGLPGLSDEKWIETVENAIELGPEHISAYMLSVEEGSALYEKTDKGEYAEVSDECAERQYRILCERLAASGYDHYEISNFAKPGRWAQHNSAYWDHVPYVGLGPAAHSFDGRRRSWNPDNLDLYIKGDGGGSETLTEEQFVEETIMLGLRTSKGVAKDFLAANADSRALAEALLCGDLVEVPAIPGSGPRAAAFSSVQGGPARLRIPESRFFVSDHIIADLI